MFFRYLDRDDREGTLSLVYDKKWKETKNIRLIFSQFNKDRENREDTLSLVNAKTEWKETKQNPPNFLTI